MEKWKVVYCNIDPLRKVCIIMNLNVQDLACLETTLIFDLLLLDLELVCFHVVNVRSEECTMQGRVVKLSIPLPLRVPVWRNIKVDRRTTIGCDASIAIHSDVICTCHTECRTRI